MDAARLLGFAFANADFLFEADARGTITFAMGAAKELMRDDGAELEGTNAAELFHAEDRARVLTLFQALEAGGRAGPVPVRLAHGGGAALSLCRLPLNQGRISCTLAHDGTRASLGASGVDTETGLAGRDAFLAAASRSASSEGIVALVDVADLPAICAKMTPQDSEKLLKHIGQNVKALGARAAARLSPTGFGIVSDDAGSAQKLAAGITSAARAQGAGHLKTNEAALALDAGGLTHEQAMLAVRHVIGRFARDPQSAVPGDVGAAFDDMLNETIERAAQFNETAAKGDFKLVLEPIVNLKTGSISHYEVLTRFQPGQSPGEIIGLAEEVGVAAVLDMAVAMKVFDLIENFPKRNYVIAFNVSGQTIGSSASFAVLLKLLEKKRSLAQRIRIEITESARMPDLAAADKAIQAMRKLGFRVGLDDFGAGAASLHYLHSLTVDFVKFDGSLIQKLGASARDDAFLRSIISTCADLNIATIAEWIDSEEKLKRARAMGFHFGQGRQFGQALDAPREEKAA